MAKASSEKTSGPPRPEHRVVALVGREAFLRQELTSSLREALEKAHGQVDTARFDGTSALPGDVLDECRSFGLLASHKLVILDDADAMIREDVRPLFERYCQNPSDGATLVLRAEKLIGGKLQGLINAVGTWYLCDEVPPDKALTWIGKRATHKYKVKIEPEAARLLIDRLGLGLARIDSELAKLAADTPEGGAITRAQVVELVGQTREEELWGVQAEILTGDPARAIAHIRRLLEGAPRDAAVPVTWACVELLRKLAGASAAIASGANPATLSKDLRIWGPGSQEVFAVARRLDPARARRLFAQAVDADAGQKSGLGRSDRVLERLAVTATAALAAPRRPAGR